MDIGNQKNDFEEAFEKNCGASSSQFERDELGFYEWRETQVAWMMWQAAKAQAVPDGFVLVPKQPTPKMIDATWNFDAEIQDMSHNSRNEFIYKAMIEAQEQANESK